LVLVKFEKDTVIDPPESEWFWFYGDDGKTLVELKDQDIYKKDLIGLKKLNDTGLVQYVSLPGDHLQFTESDIDTYFIPNLIWGNLLIRLKNIFVL